MPASNRQRRLQIIAIIVAAAMVLSLVAGAIGIVAGDRGTTPEEQEQETPEPPDVILYGDSLSFEAAAAFQLFMAANAPDADVQLTPFPGMAICDYLEAIVLDLQMAPPEVAVLEFAGNNGTDCVTEDDGERLEGQALADKYRADATAVTEILVEADVQVVWVGIPPAPGLPGEASELIDQIYRDLVEDWSERAPGQVHYAPAADAVTGPDGEYVSHLPCLDDEAQDPEAGCEDGEIQVRSDDEVHFCPGEAGDQACEEYASGARRYGEAMADAVIPLL